MWFLSIQIIFELETFNLKSPIIVKFIGASLSEPHHMRSTVKSVFLLACLLEALPYMAKNLFKCKQTLHQVHGVLATLHQTRGVLTIA